MLDKEVAIISIAVLFIMIGAYIFFFQIPAGTSGVKPVECSRDSEQSIIALPKPGHSGTTVEQAIISQDEEAHFAQFQVSLSELSNILWAAQGVLDNESGQRASPSQSGLHPMTLYVVPNHVENASCGIYRYVPESNKLELVKEGSYTEDMKKAAYGMQNVADASLVIIQTELPKPVESRYGEEGAERLDYAEAGHISQNIILESGSLGLSAVPIGVFSSEFIDSALGIDGINERAVYLTIVGMKNA
jgi:SagB-type dehydrogenase family enzyme